MFNVFHASIIFSIGWFIRNVMNFESSNTFAYFRILNVNAKVSNCFFDGNCYLLSNMNFKL